MTTTQTESDRAWLAVSELLRQRWQADTGLTVEEARRAWAALESARSLCSMYRHIVDATEGLLFFLREEVRPGSEGSREIAKILGTIYDAARVEGVHREQILPGVVGTGGDRGGGGGQGGVLRFPGPGK